jgi:hypothetical protein
MKDFDGFKDLVYRLNNGEVSKDDFYKELLRTQKGGDDAGVDEFDDIEDFDTMDISGDDEYKDRIRKKLEDDDEKQKEKELASKVVHKNKGDIKLRMSSKLKKMFVKLQGVKETKKIADFLIDNIKKLPTDDSFFNMVDDENDKLSFLPYNRINGMEKTKKDNGKVSFGAYKSPQRQTKRLGRIINQLAPDMFTPREVEIFVNAYRGEHDFMNGNIDIRIVEGRDIAYWYNQAHYNKNVHGTLNNSCMRAVPAARFDMYVNNPNKIKMATFIKNNKLEARAIIWYGDNGNIYMDRVYYTHDHLRNAFENYATKQGWYYHGQRNIPRIELRLDNMRGVNNPPYLDSMTVNRQTGVVTNNARRW